MMRRDREIGTRRFRWYAFWFLLVLVFPDAAAQQSRLDFAAALAKESDYFRAISTYKEVLFFTDEPETRQHCLFEIARAYHKSNRYKTSIQYLARLLNQPDLPGPYVPRAQVYLGLNYYGLNVYPLAETYFQRATPNDFSGMALFYSALLKAEQGQWEEASRTYLTLSQQYPAREVGTLSRQLSTEILQGNNLPRRSPLLATVLSTIVPGAGQVYNRHYYDGLQAFLFVGSFAFASFAAYRYDRDIGNNYVSTIVALSITGIFHLANIIGARRTTTYFNLRQKKMFMDRVREITFSIDY